ncbi:MAG: penicillin acylase family protein [Sedimentisphaerales bacterium]|nr:penicillin acylase family protein [Sedimentisphaerales bacterium]
MIYPGLKCIEEATILSQRAQAYAQYVLLVNEDDAMALLPIGQSEHPGGLYHLSGYDLWRRGELRPAPLSREKVEKIETSLKSL